MTPFFLCVGGPLEGRYIAQTGDVFNVALPADEGPSVLKTYSYRREVVVHGGRIRDLWVGEDLTTDTAVARLVGEP